MSKQDMGNCYACSRPPNSTVCLTGGSCLSLEKTDMMIPRRKVTDSVYNCITYRCKTSKYVKSLYYGRQISLNK